MNYELSQQFLVESIFSALASLLRLLVSEVLRTVLVSMRDSGDLVSIADNGEASLLTTNQTLQY